MEITVKMDGDTITLPVDRFLEINRGAEAEARKAREEMLKLGEEHVRFLAKNREEIDRVEDVYYKRGLADSRRILQTALNMIGKHPAAGADARAKVCARVLRDYDSDLKETEEMRARRAQTAPMDELRWRHFTPEEAAR